MDWVATLEDIQERLEYFYDHYLEDENVSITAIKECAEDIAVILDVVRG